MSELMRRALLASLGMAFLTQCGLTSSIDRTVVTSWNESGVWKRVPGTTNDYVSWDSPSRPSSDAAAGQWFSDPQDGARFYIPAKGTRAYPREILCAEACKATNRYTHRAQATRNAVHVALGPVYAVAFLFDPDNGMHNDPSGSSASTPDTSSSSSSQCKSGSNGGGMSNSCHGR